MSTEPDREASFFEARSRDVPTLYRADRVDAPGQNGAIDALLVRDGEVAAVGPFGGLREMAGSDAALVDLRPATILPGLIDSHCHLAQLGYLSSSIDVGPTAAPDIGAMQEALAKGTPDATGWVVGHGYVDDGLREHRSPTRADLDQAVPSEPCVVYHASLHVCVVNSAGLRALGLGDDIPDPPAGAFGRDVAGHLDGRLIESPMFELFAASISARLEQDGTRLLSAASHHLASFGVTGCIDANTTANELRGLAATARDDGLSVKVRALCSYDELDAILADAVLASIAPDTLSIVGAKAFADGGMSSRTAAVDPPYAEPIGESGMLLHDSSALRGMAQRCAELGIGLAIHAQGERAIAAALDAFGSPASAMLAMRRIEHGGAFAPRLRDRAVALGVRVVSQPAFLSSLGDGFLEAFGPDRAGYLYPFRSLLDAGIPLAFSSDSPVVTASPWVGIRDAVRRTTRAGALLGPEEAITFRQAFDAYTRGAAAAWGARVGTLEPGRAADFAVMDGDPFETALSEADGLRARATFIDGRPRFLA